MANPNLKVKIGGDIAEIKSALASLRGDLAKTKKDAASTNVNGLASSLKNLAGTVLGIGAVGIAIRSIFTATVAAEKAQAQLNAVLKSTAGVAGLSAKELNNMADGLQAITTYDDEAITGAQSLLLTFTKIGRDVFPQATKAVLNMSTALGQDLNSSAMLVGKALNDPIKGMAALTRSGIQFTAAQKDVITSLVETGRVAEAQAVILKELEVQFGGSAEAARNTLGGALQGLKNDFDNLLEGDSGGAGVKGATNAVKELSATLQSAEVKAGFSAIVTGLVSVIEFVAKGTAALVGFGQAVTDALSADSDKTYLGLLSKRAAIVEDLSSTPADLIFGGASGEAGYGIRKRADVIRDLEAALARIDAQITARRNANKPGPVIDYSNFLPPPPPAAGSSNGGTKTSTAARSTAKDPRVEAAERAAAEVRKINEAEEQDQQERNERIAQGLADARIDILRKTGQEAEAANQEIDAKYAQLITDLQLKGDTAGEAIIRKLIGLEKADVVVQDLKSKLQAAMEELRSKTDFINNQVGIPGGITATDAEAQLQAARAKTLAQLIELRKAAEAAYNQTPSDETFAVLRDYNSAIGEIERSQKQLENRIRDDAKGSIEGFFNDLATGAKSFKDAFKDMVVGFIQGLARMAAEALAKKAALAIFGDGSTSNGITSFLASVLGFHSGGTVGNAATFRREVPPAIFAGAPRYHDGGIAGLKPGEVPAILQTGERVLSRKETAQFANGNRPAPGVRIINTMDPSAVTDVMDSSSGEKVILNIIGRNPSRINQMLR